MINYEKQIEEEFKKHLFLEFRRSCFSDDGVRFLSESSHLIYEEMHIMPQIDDYTNTLINYLNSKINFKTKVNNITIEDNIFSGIKGCFFQKVQLNFNIIFSLKKVSNAFVVPSEDGTILEGEFNVQGPKNSIINEIKMLFEHELMHAYDNFMGLRHGKSFYNRGSYGAYGNNEDWLPKDYVTKTPAQELKVCLYYLSKIEINAYIAMFRQQLLKNVKKIKKSTDVAKIMKQTPIYGQYAEIQLMIDHLINLNDLNEQKQVLTEYNKIFNKNIRKYSDLRQILRLRYEKYLQYIFIKIAKVAYNTWKQYGGRREMATTTIIRSSKTLKDKK